MNSKKKIIYLSIAISLFVFSVVFVCEKLTENNLLTLRGSGYTTLGKIQAPVEVVLVEDFQCKKCRAFSQKIIPDLEKRYVHTGLVHFVLVPVSFLSGSGMAANAVLEVYRQNPRGYFSYVKDLLIHEGTLKKSDLLRLARRVPGVNLYQLEDCIERGCHNAQLSKNLEWAKKLMGNQFKTPAIYINGSKGDAHSFEEIREQIEKLLEGKDEPLQIRGSVSSIPKNLLGWVY